VGLVVALFHTKTLYRKDGAVEDGQDEEGYQHGDLV